MLRGLPIVLAVAAIFASDAVFVPGTQALDSTVTFSVVDAKSAAPVSYFRFLVTEDNTGDPTPSPLCSPATNPLYPDGCEWPSIRPTPSDIPVVDTGDSDDPTATLPEGKYLVSVLANDGPGTANDPDYKLGGQHFTLPDDAPTVTVKLEPTPLPLSKIRVRAFLDLRPVDGEDSIPLEGGIAGVPIIVSDTTGEMVADWFGNPICTEYYPPGVPPLFLAPDPGGSDYGVDGDGNFVPVPGTGGFCVTDETGGAVIDNLGPNIYEVQAIPPDSSGLIQTTTIEGGLSIDFWALEGNDGYVPREGFQAPLSFGFTRACEFGDPDGCDLVPASGDETVAGTGTITGTAKTVREFTPPFLVPELGDPLVRPWVALTDIGGTDRQVYADRGAADGSFTIDDVPPGDYMLAIWDEPLDYVIGFRRVLIGDGETVVLGDPNQAPGEVGVPRWFGTVKGTVFQDDGLAADGTVLPPGSAKNGIRDCVDTAIPSTCEKGLPGSDLTHRNRDGTVFDGSFTDHKGDYGYAEIKEKEKFFIQEVGYGRFETTGATWTDEFGTSVTNTDPYFLLLHSLNWAGKTSYVDWGKAPFDEAAGEHGGIAGVVIYGVTRNEFEGRLQAFEDYERGIPDVEANIYSVEKDAFGDPLLEPDGSVKRAALLATSLTDRWGHPTDCVALGADGLPIPDPLEIGPNCIEAPNLGNQMSDLGAAVFDGGYAFAEDCSDPSLDPDLDADSDGVPNRLDPDQLLDPDAGECVLLDAPADYIVEIVPPLGHKVVKEEDINVFDGNQLEPLIPPQPCAGPLHTVDVVDSLLDADFDPAFPSTTSGVYNPAFLADSPIPGGSPFEGLEMPLCDSRLVHLQPGQNPAPDFFIFTDVPIPGRIFGFLLDDNRVETDPDRLYFGEKAGVGGVPVGIRDFTGRLITTVRSDPNGMFDVTLPSTETFLCPIPGGVCPGMYKVIGNDPGDPDKPNPDFNPNYNTLEMIFDVWPGMTTLADVALIPISSHVLTEATDSQFAVPPECAVADDVPQIWRVSSPYGSAGDSFTSSQASSWRLIQ
ncbi:MAG: hypothetical protein ACE5KW_00035, partial [Dehalococcoidia bacterium]